MVNCLRCGQQFDETRLSACPQCMTPVSSATPQANVPFNSPNVRVSLTGEVIEVAPPPPPTNPAGVARPTGPGTMQSARPGSSAPPAGAKHAGLSGIELQRELVADEEAKRSRLHVVNTILGTILFLAVAGGGGWYFFTHRSNPKDTAVAYFKALGKQDWKTVYEMTALSDDDAKTYADADAFSKHMDSTISANPMQKMAFDAIGKGVDTVKAGDATIDGDKATVPITWHMTIGSVSADMNGTAHMINKGGWKFDTTGGPQAAMQNSIELIGKPNR